MNIKNCLLNFFVFLLKKKTAPNSIPSRILIVSTTALGDSLWATPAISSLKKAHPHIHLFALTSPIGFKVLKPNSLLEKIYVYKNFFSLFKLFKPLRSLNIDTILLFHTSQRAILPFCATLGAIRIIGNKGMNKDQDKYLTEASALIAEHEIQRRLNLLIPLGVHEFTYQIEFPTDKKDKEKASLWLQEKGIFKNQKIIGIHAGANDIFKQWPKENFAEVASQFAKEGYQIIFTGNDSEKELLNYLKEKVKGAHATLPSLSLSTFAALIEEFSLFITNDTGPMHLAFAKKVPTLALFTPTDAKLCGPLHIGKTKVIQKSPTCTPCIKKKCKTPFCLRQIGVKDVINNARELLPQDKNT